MTQILKNFDLKWWTSLEAQQKLTVGMAVIIFALSAIIIMLFRKIEIKNVEHEIKLERIVNKITQRHEIEKAILTKEVNDCKDNRFEDAIFFRDKFFELNNEMR